MNISIAKQTKLGEDLKWCQLELGYNSLLILVNDILSNSKDKFYMVVSGEDGLPSMPENVTLKTWKTTQILVDYPLYHTECDGD